MGGFNKKLLILGAGAFAQEVADLASGIPGIEAVAFVEGLNKDRCTEKLLGLPILWIEDLGALEESHYAVCATAQTGRVRFIEQARSLGLRFCTLVHPKAHVSKMAVIGEGSLVFPGVIVGTQTNVGRHAILNRGSLVGHHVEIGDYVTVSPGANIASNTKVGQYSYIGMGSNIIDRKLTVGCNAMVGAGSIVLANVPDDVVVFGVPASVVQQRPALSTLGSTIEEIISKVANHSPDASVIGAPGRDPLSYKALNLQVRNIRDELRRLGIRQEDRVAIVLPNGPEMAMAFLSVACSAVAAPLNPAYPESEFEFYLSDLAVVAIIVEEDDQSPAISAAGKLGIRVIRLTRSDGNIAGNFDLKGVNTGSAVEKSRTPRPDDVALILHTSGTTSRPKQVPLTHGNLCASAENTRLLLRLSAADCCLNIMPLFHIHGLVGALLASVAAGASVICTPGFTGPNFFELLRQFRASWYTAVPTIHQSVVALLERCPDDRPKHYLRFVRSSSSALPPQVAEDLEKGLGVPVIEAYGMTEAAHQMASNPLPPKPRKAGSVGLAAGPDVAIMDIDGNLLRDGETGEIVIKGSNVTLGYIGNPEANQESYSDGWFRTGDEGSIDEDGYLFIKGRLKEIINRGGEKISPREVDEALLAHPAVFQAVAFAVPNVRLGESVGAAVVLKAGLYPTERELREFLAERLAHFKVPAQILFVKEIPKGPTGKLQRIGLSELLGLSESETIVDRGAPPVEPRSPIEEKLVAIWREILKLETVGVEDRFVDVGGDSLLATLLVTMIDRELGVALSMLDMADASTIAEQANIIEDLRKPLQS